MKTSLNKTWEKQAKKLLPMSCRKAIVTAVYPNNCTVDVYFIGNNQTVIRNIPVASSVDINYVAQGDRCKIDLFDESNPNDMVMAYVYGKPQKKKYSSGTIAVDFSGTVIPHGLGVVPDLISIIVNGSGVVFQTAPADASNIYLTYDAIAGSLSTNWYAVKF